MELKCHTCHKEVYIGDQILYAKYENLGARKRLLNLQYNYKLTEQKLKDISNAMPGEGFVFCCRNHFMGYAQEACVIGGGAVDDN